MISSSAISYPKPLPTNRLAHTPSVKFAAGDSGEDVPKWIAEGIKYWQAGKKFVSIPQMITAVGNAVIAPIANNVLGPAVKHRLEGSHRLKQAYEVLKPKDLQNIGFDQVVGHDAVKAELQSFVERQKFPKLHEHLYKNDVRGRNNYLLLEGPPGTGKTLLAKAIASNLENTAFIKLDCENLVQSESGSGPAIIAQIEKKAAKLKQKRLIFFLDELDAIGSRESLGTDNVERYNTLTRLLKMLDGVKGFKGKELLVIGATNKPNLIDDALLNRFRQIITVPAPTSEELKQMYRLYIDQKDLLEDGSLDMDAIAEASVGFTGRKVEQAVSILKDARIRALSPKVMAEMEKQLKKPKNLEPFKLIFTQEDLMKAIQAAQSHLVISKNDLDLAA